MLGGNSLVLHQNREGNPTAGTSYQEEVLGPGVGPKGRAGGLGCELIRTVVQESGKSPPVTEHPHHYG